jgi:SPP1 family phage portal protein
MLQEAYETDYPILHEPLKPKWKPDNRIMVNFAKYIVDTMNGFFIGHPIKLQVDDGNEAVEKYVDFLDFNAIIVDFLSVMGYSIYRE